MVMNSTRLCCGLLLLICMCSCSSRQKRKSWSCEKVTIPICQDMGYNITRMPNRIGHETQQEAQLELDTYRPLIEFGCASQLKFFLCSVYVPMCTEQIDVLISSCRPLCEHVKRRCVPVLKQFGISWAANLNCSRFLPQNEGGLKMCMPGPEIVSTKAPTYLPSTSPQATKRRVNTGSEQCRKFKNSENYYYVKGTESCALYCNQDGIFTAEDKKTMDKWMAAWSILCFVSTTITLATFLIDTARYKYPERSIIWIALCYNFYSVAYIVRLAAGREVISCDKDVSGVEHLVQDGLRNTGCAIVFLVQYFFSMAAIIWWVILALTWFLAAGMKWGNEAIGSYANLFHVISWTLPCIKTIFILITRKVDGDELTGLCFVGNQDLIALTAFVLGPEFTYLIIGTLFLIAGFVAMFKVRARIQRDGNTKTDKLERLMVRIGVFSVLSTIPTTAVIACYFYEYANKEYWYYGRRETGIAEPNISIFMLKTFMSLFVGIISGIWVWSKKTVHSWRTFYGNRCRRRGTTSQRNFSRATKSKTGETTV